MVAPRGPWGDGLEKGDWEGWKGNDPRLLFLVGGIRSWMDPAPGVGHVPTELRALPVQLALACPAGLLSALVRVRNAVWILARSAGNPDAKHHRGVRRVKRAHLLISHDSVYAFRALRFFSGVRLYAIVERQQDS
jgi:hypothetical protein